MHRGNQIDHKSLQHSAGKYTEAREELTSSESDDGDSLQKNIQAGCGVDDNCNTYPRFSALKCCTIPKEGSVQCQHVQLIPSSSSTVIKVEKWITECKPHPLKITLNHQCS
ncbi:unnamed protein product [Brugia pahangi]|uniref:Ragulator complex protein LAMTOR5 n=1 Tax=Brugia pahangi TaxID=6280 RepID=A0A0N4TPB1_BRUPA|nr:unnamed protein product [Brugia pahangi]